MLGPGGVCLSDDVTSAQVLDGGTGGGLDVGAVAGTLARLHGTAVALSRPRADAAHAHIGDRISLMPVDGTHTNATLDPTYTRCLGFGYAPSALLPLSHALTGGYSPFVPGKPLLGILGGSAVLARHALAVPTRRALRARPIAAVGVAE